MGNTALKEKFGLTGRRVSASDFLVKQDELKDCFLSSTTVQMLGVNDSRIIFPKSFSDKESHGDIDVIVFLKYAENLSYKEVEDWIKESFGAEFVSKNDHVYPFLFDGVQIDMSLFGDYEVAISKYFYTNYSPAGNILGKMVKQFGLKLGWDGLYYPVKISDSEQLGDIFITFDFQKSIEFLGLNWKRYQHGFKNQVEFFEYVCQSPRFNSDIFKFENMSNKSRVRDRKRPEYAAWVDFAGDKQNNFTGDKNKSVYIDEISSFFNVNLHKEINRKFSLHAFNNALKQKFNGKVVEGETGYKDKELGIFIERFKKHISSGNDDKWKSWLYLATAENVRAEINNFKNKK